MKNLLIAFFLIIFVTTLVNGQHLVRKGWLGVQFENVNTGEAVRQNLPVSSGVRVQQVFPGSTAEALGLQMEDIILNCNDKPISEINDLLEVASNFRSGDIIAMDVMRNGNMLQTNGHVIARPHESAENGEVIYGEMAYLEGYIRTIINKPAGEGPFPTLFYLQGYTCSSIDNMAPTYTVKQLIEGLVEKGYVVFRMEKPGVGDSYNLPDCREIDYETEINAFKKGLESLKEFSFIDKNNIFLFGHSLGGIAAPLISVDNPPNGIIVYGTVLKPWAEYMMDIYRYQRQLWGMDFLKIENDARVMFPLLSDYLVHKKPPAELAANNSDYAHALTTSLGYNDRGLILDRHYTFWQQLQDKNLTEAWKMAGVNTFAIYGEADIAAINPKDHETIASVVNAYHPGKGRFLLLPHTDHGLLLTGTMEDNLKLSSEERRQKPFNTEVVGIIDEWMKENMVI